MSLLPALPLLVLLAGAGEPAWQQVTRDDGITVLARTPEGGSVAEVKATALVDAPPQDVWRVIRDYPNYKKTMPYTEESRVLSSEQDGKVIVFHCLVNAPLVDKRDFIIRIVDESDWKDGKGFLKTTWTLATEGLPPEREGVVRVKLNKGYWLLEPREEGKKTFVTYYLYTDPGGSLPRWIADRANKTSVPDVLRAVRKYATKK
ncbi:SRPBCC family protein [Archangium violaceum]|uniref:START domain-containing protein n=1 Tax=Archangium violaceum TaxID=83451 RepID=UPI00194F5F3E|nr:START domain-containing protein [Archangium violaceum]QRN94077.1 SRPBCC family protein [Archangium violaceum]